MNMRNLWILCGCSLLAATSPMQAAQGASCGAKLVKADLEPAGTPPDVRVLDNAGAWRLLREEAWTGTNAREFYFTLQSDGALPPPAVEVHWPGVRIARVLGADGKAEPLGDGVRFKMRKGRAPTSVKTSLDYGIIHMAVFHNWEARPLRFRDELSQRPRRSSAAFPHHAGLAGLDQHAGGAFPAR